MTNIVPTNVPEVVAWKTAQRVAKTEFAPAGFRNRPEAIFAAILYGRELGIGPMQSLQSINVIEGKPTLAPEAMRARVYAAGHKIKTTTYTDEVVTLVGTRTDNGDSETVSWSLEDARRAGLIRPRGAWTTYPRAMLLARATGELCRLLFPDVISGVSYTPEEIDVAEDVVDNEAVHDVVDNDVVETAEVVAVGVDNVESPPHMQAAPAPEPALAPTQDTGSVDAAAEPVSDHATPLRIHNAQVKVKELVASGIKVADARLAHKLPPLTKKIDDGLILTRWEALIEDLEHERTMLERPFAEPACNADAEAV